MTHSETERFERILGALRAGLVSALHGRRHDLMVLPSADPLDRTRDLSELDLDSQQVSMLTFKLRNLDAALHRLREGTFGRCDSCDGEIPKRRLEAVPWSLLCVACQEAAEARAAAEPGDTDLLEAEPPKPVRPPAARNGGSPWIPPGTRRLSGAVVGSQRSMRASPARTA
jgi:DnaK suppressor protein